MEADRQESARQVLRSHRRRPQTTHRRTIPLEPDERGHCRPDESGRSMTWRTRLFRRSKLDHELDQEIHAHLAMAATDRIERGESPAQASAGARREFGNQLLTKEVTRQKWGFGGLERLGQDLKFALRQLKRNPSFALIAILSLTLGIGA